MILEPEDTDENRILDQLEYTLWLVPATLPFLTTGCGRSLTGSSMYWNR